MNKPLTLTLIIFAAGVWTGLCFVLFFLSWFAPSGLIYFIFIPLFPFMVSMWIGMMGKFYLYNVAMQYLIVFIMTFGVSFIFLYIIYLMGIATEKVVKKLKFF